VPGVRNTADLEAAADCPERTTAIGAVASTTDRIRLGRTRRRLPGRECGLGRKRFGPPPGAPGCRVDVAVLRENG
jgi:hypothetical protein